MDIYLVGGAVRDALLAAQAPKRANGQAPQRSHDRDWVVVGSTPQAMDALGFVPVGKDFPVFLHPKTHEEYALARTERKTAQGYKGFAVAANEHVTLQADLARRDLTINAMALPLAWVQALDPSAGDWPRAVIDPWGGQADLQARLLRHVTPAFAEDPVRILRVARFAAQLSGFGVAADTLQLMRQMVAHGEVAHLVPERVWQELARGLMGPQPGRMLQVLRDCGALAVLLPEVDARWHAPDVLQGLAAAAHAAAPLQVRLAGLLMHTGAQATRAVAQRLRLPSDCQALAQVVAQEHRAIAHSADAGVSAADLLQLLMRCDALRQPERFENVLLTCRTCAACDTERLHLAWQAARSVATAPVAQAAALAGLTGPAVGQRIEAARLHAVAHALGLQLAAPTASAPAPPPPN